MLAIDAARTSGFRDSLYYFRRNLLAFKLNATQAEKELLIEQGKLGSHLKTRSVTLVTARSAFKLHGSKMVIGLCFLSAPSSIFSLRVDKSTQMGDG
jgi:chromatin structure-remodeling complex protein RSC7